MAEDDLNLVNDDDMERMANRLSLLGKAAIDRFRAQLSVDSDSSAKARAIHVLGFLKEDSAFTLIVEQLKSNDLTVAQAAVSALKSYNTQESHEVLQSLLLKDNLALSRKALKALNDLSVELPDSILEKILASPNWPLREELVYYLAGRKSVENTSLIEKLLNDEHLLVRKTANKYL